MTTLKALIEAINDVHTNVWAVLIIFAGVAVCFSRVGPTGGAPLLTLGGAILQAQK